MATTNIELDIENITGVADADDQFIKTAQKFVVSSIPKDLMLWAGTSTAAATHGGDDSPEAVTLPQPTDSIIDVVRNGFSAEQVPESMQGFIKNSNSLHKATATFPKYYIQAGNKVIVNPVPTASATVLVNYVDFLKVDDDCDLRGAVVFHASSQEFEKLATSKVSDWSDLVQPSSPTLTTTTVSFSTSVPTYLSPALEARSAFSAYTSGLSETAPGIFSITAGTPSSPSLPSLASPGVGTVNVASLPTAPGYSPPTVGGATESLTAAMDADSSGYGTEADFLNYSKWFSVLSEFIEDEEDSELAAAQLQKINTYISSYQAAMQDELNTFNEANALYQAGIQKIIQQSNIDSQEAQKEGDLTFQATIQDYTLELQKYGADVGKYQAEVNTQVQEYSQKLSQYQAELQISVQAWQQEENEKVARFQSEVQNNINKFNKENTEYQAQLQISIQNAQLESSDDAQKLQKFASDLQSYTSKINEQSQKFTLSSQNAVHYSNESKKYYEWAITEINMYIQNNSKMISTTMAAQASQQQRA